jgi:hypothetical protein
MGLFIIGGTRIQMSDQAAELCAALNWLHLEAGNLPNSGRKSEFARDDHRTVRNFYLFLFQKAGAAPQS